MDVPDSFRRYARRATADIDDRRDRLAAEEELTAHLLDRYAAARESGVPGAAAEADALRAMGDASDLAGSIGEAHRPRWRPGVVVGLVLGGVAVLVLIWAALFLAFAVMAAPG